MARNMRPAHMEAASTRGSLNVGRFYFRVKVDSGQIFDIYYDRAMKNLDDRKGQWFVYGNFKYKGSKMKNHSTEPIFLQDSEADPAIAHWSIFDTWLGVAILIILILLILIASVLVPSPAAGIFLMIGLELLLLVPIAVIFLWRKISWRELGFRKFEWKMIGLGCGILLIVYPVIFIHNLILALLGVTTQGNAVLERFSHLGSPILFFFVGVVMAPLMEETFFRGFLFKGFRQKYGWKAALFFSSLIFGLSHLQLAALFPTFLLGCVLAYIYHRTNSLFPGMILHFIINLWGLCAIFSLYKLKGA